MNKNPRFNKSDSEFNHYLEKLIRSAIPKNQDLIPSNKELFRFYLKKHVSLLVSHRLHGAIETIVPLEY